MTVPNPDYEALQNLRVGDKIDGGFDLHSELGRGGSGVIFEAWDSQLRRFVALKIPRSEAACSTMLTEAQALAAFRHEGLPTVHAIREHCGVPFLVLERLHGHSLYEVISRHTEQAPLPWREGLHYLIAIAEILQVLHRANLVHRDIKPENIMVCPSGRVVVLDLGIVQQEQQFEDGQRSGTPSHIAPEVISSAVKVGGGHLLDVYSLGVVAFELLTGALPYDSESLHGLFDEILKAPIPRVRASHSEVPRPLDLLVHSMMAKSPDDRPDSIDAILHKLHAIAEGRTLRSRHLPLDVIMVDDDPDYLDLMQTCSELVDHNIDLRVASDGVEGLAMFRERPCDLMIVDLEMPNMNGLELCMYLHGMPSARDTLVAVLSGKARPQDRALLSELGVIDFVEKSSLDLAGLVDRLNEMLNKALTVRSNLSSTTDEDTPL